jgi:hypothetical protein
MIHPIAAIDYVNGLIKDALESSEVVNLMSPLPVPVVYWQGLNVSELIDGVVNINIHHKSIRKTPSYVGHRIIYEDRAVFLELKSPLNLEDGFDKIERLSFLLEEKLSVNIKNENSDVRLKAPATEYSDYKEGYNSIVLSIGYSFETDLNSRVSPS